eukprot:scpid86462/ scgid26209/ 
MATPGYSASPSTFGISPSSNGTSPSSNGTSASASEKKKQAGGDTQASLGSVFMGDAKDMMLIGYYNTLIKLSDGFSDPPDPTLCSDTEQIIDWIAYGVIVIIYIVRHFVEKDLLALKKSEKIARCLVFLLFNLCLHSQPIACSLPREYSQGDTGNLINTTTGAVNLAGSEHLSLLSYIQGAVLLTMTVAVTTLCPKLLRSEKKPAPKKTSGPVPSDGGSTPAGNGSSHDIERGVVHAAPATNGQTSLTHSDGREFRRSASSNRTVESPV